jgi:hypothetical protein
MVASIASRPHLEVFGDGVWSLECLAGSDDILAGTGDRSLIPYFNA